jgi:hypothetical protein
VHPSCQTLGVMEKPHYIESTPAMRAKLVAFGAAAILVGLAFDLWLKPLLQGIASLPTCESLPWVRGELLVSIAVSWYIGSVAYQQAKRTWRFQQTPLPDAWVWARTRVRTGASATASAIAFYAVSALFLAGPPVLVVWQKLYLIFCIPQSCGC